MTSYWPSVTATVASLNDVGNVNAPSPSDNDILRYDAVSGEWVNETIDISRTLTVGGTGCQYTSINAAIADAVSGGMSSASPWLILVYPGTYAESVQVFDGLRLKSAGGAYSSLVKIAPASGDAIYATGTGISVAIHGIDLYMERSDATDKLININCDATSTVEFTGGGIFQYIHLADYANTSSVYIKCGYLYVIDTSYFYVGYASATNNIIAAEYDIEYDCEMNAFSHTFLSYALSGNEIVASFTGPAETDVGLSPFNHSVDNSSSTSHVDVFSFGACTANLQRLILACPIRIVTNSSSSEAHFFRLDSSGAECSLRVANCDLNQQGYATANVQFCDVASTDLVTIDGCVANEDWGYTGDGKYLNLPIDSGDSGFISWIGSGNYWSRTGTTFTVLRGGVGRIKSVPRSFAAAQSVTLTTEAINFVYPNKAGTMSVTTSSTTAFNDGFPLFEVWLDDNNNAIVVKENHPFEFDSSVSRTWHKVFGSLIAGEGANIDAILPLTSRTIELIGDAELIDHGLETTISDSGGAALTFTVVYTKISTTGKAKVHSIASALPVLYNNAGTPTATTNFIVYRLGVTKDGLNTSTPNFIALMDSSTYANSAAALAAIESGNIADFPSEIKGLETARLGYVIIRGSTSAITDVVIDKQTALTVANSGAAVNQASLVQTDTSSFNNFLSGSQTTSQSVFNILDNLDPDSARAVSMFGTNATTVNIGRTGQTVAFLGNVSVAGTLTLTGATVAGSPTWSAGQTFPTVTLSSGELNFSSTGTAAANKIVRTASGIDINNSALVVGSSITASVSFLAGDATAKVKLVGVSSVATIYGRNGTDTGYASMIVDASQIIFRYTGTEAGRFDTSGNFGVGTFGSEHFKVTASAITTNVPVTVNTSSAADSLLVESTSVAAAIGIDSTASGGEKWRLYSQATGSTLGAGHFGLYNVDNNKYVLAATYQSITANVPVTVNNLLTARRYGANAALAYGREAAGWGIIGANNADAFMLYAGGTGTDPSVGSLLAYVSQAGAVTLGPASGSVTHTLRSGGVNSLTVSDTAITTSVPVTAYDNKNGFGVPLIVSNTDTGTSSASAVAVLSGTGNMSVFVLGQTTTAWGGYGTAGERGIYSSSTGGGSFNIVQASTAHKIRLRVGTIPTDTSSQLVIALTEAAFNVPVTIGAASTTTTAVHSIYGRGNFYLNNTNVIQLATSATAGSSRQMILFYTSASGPASGTASGGIAATDGSTSPTFFTGTSDARLKKDITDAPLGALARLCGVRLRDFRLLDDDDSSPKKRGVIAQELQQVYPDKVHEREDGFLNVSMGYDWEFIQAIQELASQNDELRAEINNLKSA